MQKNEEKEIQGKQKRPTDKNISKLSRDKAKKITTATMRKIEGTSQRKKEKQIEQ